MLEQCKPSCAVGYLMQASLLGLDPVFSAWGQPSAVAG